MRGTPHTPGIKSIASLEKLRLVVRGPLLRWFKANQRKFPWRRSRTAYRVWISEMMLQQTRADQVIPYFNRFVKKFPGLRRLAGASRQEVLKLWEGLGYYSRARRIHEAAIYLCAERQGRFPRTLEGLRSLPGIGPYSAAAIGSLALGIDLAVVDGNVIRVVSRLLAFSGSPQSRAGRQVIQATVDALLIPGRAGLFNEAMMELGALCCVPRKPTCPVCPFRKVCRAFLQGDPEAYPLRVKKPRVPHKIVGAGVVVNRKGDLLIARRKDDAMLGGLWEFPGGTLEKGETIRQCIARELKEEMGIETRIGGRLVTVRHAYSHFTIDLHAYWAVIRKGNPQCIHCADFAWVSVEEMASYPFSRADLKIIEELKKAVRNIHQ
ncbi:MAG: A/G-specific adenine glycosylase [Lentisphaerota bacterium]